MPTNYYWLEGDEPKGPVAFRELIAMVQDQRLVESDLVRPDYSKEWQAAETVIGLFYMASRVPVSSGSEQALLVQPASDGTEFQADDIGEMLAQFEELAIQQKDSQIADIGDSGYTSNVDGVQAVSLGNWTPGIATRHTNPVATSLLPGLKKWIASNRTTLAVAVGIAVVGWACRIYFFGNSSDNNCYQELTAILTSLDEQRRSQSPEFGPIRLRIERVIREYPPLLIRNGASRQNIIKLKFLFVTRDLMPALLATDLSSPSIEEFHMITCLHEVGDSLGIKE